MKKTLKNRINLCFSKNDVRCVANKQLDKEIAYLTGRAIIEYLKCKEFIVGHDMRTTSHELRDAFIDGIRDQGSNVLDIGEIDTPALYFASGTLNLPGGMITASHNPAKYNGIKITKAKAIPIGDKTGLNIIKKLVQKNKFTKAKIRGKRKKINLSSKYRSYLQSFITPSKIKNIKIYEVPISYFGRTYDEGKKIGWKDGFSAMWSILKFNAFTSDDQSFSKPISTILNDL